MTTSALKVDFAADTFSVSLSDARLLVVPLVWFPRLLNATDEQRRAHTLSANGIHWESLDEDISVAGLLAGRGDLGVTAKLAA